ncbi:MAG TPA: GNAT family N-acetyltransferase, partial [Clostridiaceae bacterium]|nr:GNAT family N-acetyltransferase [Clostridiaceae bacterium]
MKEKTDFKHKPIITGERMILRPFKEDDFDEMIVILNEPDVRM